MIIQPVAPTDRTIHPARQRHRPARMLPRRRLPAAALPSVLLLMLTAGPVTAAADRLDLICTEQISRQVVFGDQGKVHYEERTPEAPEEVSLTLLRPAPSADADPDAARIESSAPYLASNAATWIADRQVESHSGQVRIDLLTNVLSVADIADSGSASFRRFQCRPAAAQD
ncbi:MAG: hypothetical protein EA400_05265 [Chromatiaceae bacterium]|nr:MAG: hypothetical protein EA400_05265 [Chromatiaceae bacterium]